MGIVLKHHTSGEEVENPTAKQVSAAIRSIGRSENAVILENTSRPGEYMVTSVSAETPDGYTVEYTEGNDRQGFIREVTGRKELEQLFLSFRRQDEEYKHGAWRSHRSQGQPFKVPVLAWFFFFPVTLVAGLFAVGAGAVAVYEAIQLPNLQQQVVCREGEENGCWLRQQGGIQGAYNRNAQDSILATGTRWEFRAEGGELLPFSVPRGEESSVELVSLRWMWDGQPATVWTWNGDVVAVQHPEEGRILTQRTGFAHSLFQLAIVMIVGAAGIWSAGLFYSLRTGTRSGVRSWSTPIGFLSVGLAAVLIVVVNLAWYSA